MNQLTKNLKTHSKKALFSLFLLFSGFSIGVNGQITAVNTGLTAAQIVNDLIGPGIQTSNVTLNCPALAFGTFTTGAVPSNLGISEGVLLTSGEATVPGDPSSTFNSFGAGTAGTDPDLISVCNPYLIFDECILEFDLAAACDTIEIAYVFASEEYPEYVTQGFNETFGFFISGPGIVGTQNIALVPATTTPVTIDNVNLGWYYCPGPTAGCNNCAYYVDNCSGNSVVYDGFTTPLLAKSAVMPCSTYHLKLAICDAGDGAFDSGVFLEKNGIQCSTPQVTVTASSTLIAGNSLAVEGCLDAVFNFVRAGDLTVALDISYSITGSAIMGTDYNNIVDTVHFAIGQDSSQVFISAPDDGIVEGIEFIYIIINDTVCTTTFADTAILAISDKPTADFDFVTTCYRFPVNFTDQSTFPAGPVTSWLWDFGDGNTSVFQNPGHTYGSPGNYNVSLTATVFGVCSGTVTMTISVVGDPVADFSHTPICKDNIVTFTDLSTSTPPGSISTWYWDFDNGSTSNLQNPTTIFSDLLPHNLMFVVTSAAGCVDTLFEVLQPDEVLAPDIIDDTVCSGFPSTLFAFPIEGGTWNEWFLSDSATQPFFIGNSWTTPPLTNFVSYWIETVDSNGCRSPRAGATAFVAFPGIVYLVTNGREFEIPNAIVEFSVTNPLIFTYFLWDFGDGTTSEFSNPIHQYNQPGVYTVTLITNNSEGCDQKLVWNEYITVKDNIRLFVPNIFTPNGDGLNDFLEIGTQLISYINIQIFDRWGKLIFESSNPGFKWDGKDPGGLDLPEGAYVFKIVAQDYLGRPFEDRGSVVLTR